MLADQKEKVIELLYRYIGNNQLYGLCVIDDLCSFNNKWVTSKFIKGLNTTLVDSVYFI